MAILGQLWGNSGATVGQLWGNCGAIVGQLWGNCGAIVLVNCGAIVGQLWVILGVYASGFKVYNLSLAPRLSLKGPHAIKIERLGSVVDLITKAGARGFREGNASAWGTTYQS